MHESAFGADGARIAGPRRAASIACRRASSTARWRSTSTSTAREFRTRRGRMIGDWLDERIVTATRSNAARSPRSRAARAGRARSAGAPRSSSSSWRSPRSLMTTYAPTPQSRVGERSVRDARGPWRMARSRRAPLRVARDGHPRRRAHLVHVIAVGAYKKPREVWFWLGLALALLLLASAITGHALHGSARILGAARRERNHRDGAGDRRVAPADDPRRPELGALGLARMHAAHVAILPANRRCSLHGARVGRAKAVSGRQRDPYSKQLARISSSRSSCSRCAFGCRAWSGAARSTRRPTHRAIIPRARSGF